MDKNTMQFREISRLPAAKGQSTRSRKLRMHLDLYGMNEAGDLRNGPVMVRSLGIKYETATGHAIGDCFIFEGVDPDTVPDVLPPYLTIMGS